MRSTDPQNPRRNARQEELLPPARLARCHGVVVGLGAIGRPVALQLAALGVPALSLYDPAPVTAEDLGSAGYWAEDVGRPRVHPTANLCHQQFPLLDLHAIAMRLGRRALSDWPAGKEAIVFCCVDSRERRQLVWEAVRGAAAFVAAGWQAGEAVRVRATGRPASVESFCETSPGGGEERPRHPRSASTIYAGCVAAGLLVAQFSRWLRGLPVVAEQTLDLAGPALRVPGRPG